MLNDLLQLIKENPDLPVIPMVDSDVVAGDEYGYWIGSIGKCEVREFAIDVGGSFSDEQITYS